VLVFAPPGMNNCFSSWWCCTIKSVPRVEHNGLNTLIILVAWEIWKHRNACVFEGAKPNIEVLLDSVASEGALWCLAGASALQGFWLGRS
jgi:hypothetical protein